MNMNMGGCAVGCSEPQNFATDKDKNTEYLYVGGGDRIYEYEAGDFVGGGAS